MWIGVWYSKGKGFKLHVVSTNVHRHRQPSFSLCFKAKVFLRPKVTSFTSWCSFFFSLTKHVVDTNKHRQTKTLLAFSVRESLNVTSSCFVRARLLIVELTHPGNFCWSVKQQKHQWKQSSFETFLTPNTNFSLTVKRPNFVVTKQQTNEGTSFFLLAEEAELNKKKDHLGARTLWTAVIFAKVALEKVINIELKFYLVK